MHTDIRRRSTFRHFLVSEYQSYYTSSDHYFVFSSHVIRTSVSYQLHDVCAVSLLWCMKRVHQPADALKLEFYKRLCIQTDVTAGADLLILLEANKA